MCVYGWRYRDVALLDSGEVSRTGCRDEAQPVRQRRVVDEGVGDHFFGCCQ